MRYSSNNNNSSSSSSSSSSSKQMQILAIMDLREHPRIEVLSCFGEVLAICHRSRRDCESMPSHTEEEEAYRSFSRTVLSSSNSEHRALIEEGAHFSRHQLAIHTVRNTAGASEAIVMLMTALIKDSRLAVPQSGARIKWY